MRFYLRWLLVFVLLARSVLPAGFMLGTPADGQGTLTIVVCTGQGSESLTLDADGNPVPENKSGGDGAICPFAAAGPFAVAMVEPPNLAGEILYAEIIYRRELIRFSATPRAGALSARGPPQILS